MRGEQMVDIAPVVAAKRKRWIAAVFIAAVLAAVAWYFRRPLVDWFDAAATWMYDRLKSFIDWVDALGAVGPLVFIVGYALMTVALIPASILTLGAGAVFGLAGGLVYSLAGASLGAALAFLISRHFARSLIEKRVGRSRRFVAIDQAVGKHGLKICALLRLSPIFPFVILNYVLGLTRVRFLHYNLASLAMVPGTLLYVYYGSLAKDVTELAAEDVEPEGWGKFIVRLTGLIATVIVTMIVTRIARRALREEMPSDVVEPEAVEENA